MINICNTLLLAEVQPRQLEHTFLTKIAERNTNVTVNEEMIKERKKIYAEQCILYTL